MNEYLLRVFYAMKRELQKFTFGATIATIGMDDVAKLVTPVPPVAEQRAIATHVAGATTGLNEALARETELIAAIDEYRTRLFADGQTPGRTGT